MNKPLAVSRDLVKNLQRLAAASAQDDDAFELAKKQYLQAGNQAISSTSEFAIALYDFTLVYAATPKLVEDKLKELGLQFKRTSTVYNHIARLAFLNLPDSDAKRVRISRYADLIDRAHKQGLTSADFKKIASNGLARALLKLEPAAAPKNSKMLQQGRAAASELLANKEFELRGITAPEFVKDGSDVQLLARCTDGRLIVYGIVPPDIAAADSILAKIVRANAAPDITAGDVLPALMKTLKLVGASDDSQEQASYRVRDHKLHFIVNAKNGLAVLSASQDYDLFKRDITLTVADWHRLVATLSPLRKHITAVDFDRNSCVVSVNDAAVPNIHTWMEQHEKSISIGKASGATMLIDLDDTGTHLDEPTGRWETVSTVPVAALAKALEFKPSKQFTSVSFAADTIKFAALARRSEDQLNLTKASFRKLKAACSKLAKLADAVKFERRKDELRLLAETDMQLNYAVILGIN